VSGFTGFYSLLIFLRRPKFEKCFRDNVSTFFMEKAIPSVKDLFHLMSNFRSWIPLPMPHPIKTFPQRLMRKWLYIVDNVIATIGPRLGFSGAKIMGVTQNGNTLLQLNKNYALGPRGTYLELPQDLCIFESVRRRGNWELEESEFLARGLRKVGQSSNSNAALLDIGANTGLVTLQAMNLSKSSIEVFLFEPIPRHVSAVRHNLRNLGKIHINEFALSDKNGFAEISTMPTNHGGTSLLESAVPSAGSIRTHIELVDTAEYCDGFLNEFDNYIIKCDTEGMDALILSRIPNRIWQSTEVAIIEVWALPEIIEQDVTRLLAMCQYFEYASWNPKSRERISLDEISEYWLSKSGTMKNLFFSKTIPF
jgi:FkbM family methyltransferase